jgi:acetoin:2,6-dichlorophenolindophenol oxidoreductase subunit alpha
MPKTDQRSDESTPGATGAAGLSDADGLDLLTTMWRIRALEERVGQLKRADEIYGLVHLSIGGEGVAAAVCGQLLASDAVYSGHRAHGHALAQGAPSDRLMAELMGRDTGLCRGLGGSMHLVDREHGFFGATGVVGGNLPLAVGTALAAQLRGGRDVTVVFFGDGAVQAGTFHESINLATLWKLPLVFVCENNGFAEFTPRSAHTNVERVSDVVAPYGLQRGTVSGSDVAEVWNAFGAFQQAARDGGGPFLLECLTHRRRGHYEGDADSYRVADEAEWERKDPIARLTERGLADGWLTAQLRDSLEAEARAEIEAATEFARTSPYPPPELPAQMTYAQDGAS